MVTASVDITALKARHPLGDTVEAAGVRLRGRGRVRQGVCPFHDEAEGSFTVYADSERFYCFGCGRGRRRAGLHPAAPRASRCRRPSRGWTAAPGLRPRAATRPAGTRRPRSAALPPRDPALLTAAARFYAGRLRRSHRSAGVPGLTGHRPSPPQPASVSAMRRAAGCGRPWSPCGFSEKRIRDSGLFMERGAERFAGMVVVPDALQRPRPLARRPGRRSPTGRPASRLRPAPSRCSASGVSAPRRPGRSLPKASSTGSPLPGGASHPAPLSEPRALSESPPPSGAAPAFSSPSTATPRA